MYDPLVAKLIVWDLDREAATRRMLRALEEYEITDLRTLIPFHLALLSSEQWGRGETCRDLVEDRAWLKRLAAPTPAPTEDEEAPPKVEQDYTVEVSGRRFDVMVIGPPGAGAVTGAAPGTPAAPKPRRRESATAGGAGAGGDQLISPIQGTVLKVAVEPGAAVDEGALICVIEAMKMENEITAHKTGKVADLPIAVGASVASGDTIAVIASD